MKKISIDYKFTIDIDEKYFDDNYCNTESKPAIIMLRAECESVSVEDLVNVIISCTFDENGLLFRYYLYLKQYNFFLENSYLIYLIL